MALYKRHEIEENTILNNIIKENYNKKILSSNHKIFSIGLNYHMTVQTSHILFSKFHPFLNFQLQYKAHHNHKFMLFFINKNYSIKTNHNFLHYTVCLR